ncbi:MULTISPECIES: hypothetical protein [Nostoc]|uniref:Uncharacterized protein n=2 Tax=Nostoc TaxID=1177 RepID=A0ABR8I6U2_9NOSO|nr:MULTISPECIES: hypothetical protein [Nostoc]MBD2561764.1 hypothetical protein [Nostoc linckia FACHB-391]MBD2647334.1 hypothetical protein [Nostoc foliaceum FACHB-393]MBG1241945.1 hypothetical protein [Nostoc sp. NZL]
MPSGHASHKGTSDKPNVNANGVIDDAADKTLNPDDLLSEEQTNTEIHRVEESVKYPPATERPGEKSNTNT